MFCLLSGTGLCDELISRPEESYRLWRVVECDQETSCNEVIAQAGLQCQRERERERESYISNYKENVELLTTGFKRHLPVLCFVSLIKLFKYKIRPVTVIDIEMNN
jgi:hypothetical protein